MTDLLTIKEASQWASEYLEKNVTVSNISYLIQYGRIPKKGNNGCVLINRADLEDYYRSHHSIKEESWKRQLGHDLNWHLSFSEYKESETTKHVHRLHPYKGKFIPQLVEYFLDSHVDEFKTESFFYPGDIVLDPFCGSGTTLVQANELGIHALGIDVSPFNAFISNSKIDTYDLDAVRKSASLITSELKNFQKNRNNIEFEECLLEELKKFNSLYFPTPDYKFRVRRKEINEKLYGEEKEREFLPVYYSLVEKYGISLKQQSDHTFLDKWYLKVVRDEIDFIFSQIKLIEDRTVKKILAVVLSRTIRSCRATTHSDLATLFEPVVSTYYCKKHGKICKPLFSITGWWNRYVEDTITRIRQFGKLRTETFQLCMAGDSRVINIFDEVDKKHDAFGRLLRKDKIKGIFSSPPYVGLIDYHEQHAYAYDLFGFERRDDLEIGPLYKGQGRSAKESYVKGISDVLINCRKYLQDDFDIFLVANDKYGLYSDIAEQSGMQIVNQFKRPVLNRVEKDRSAYSEIIFHLKAK